MTERGSSSSMNDDAREPTADELRLMEYLDGRLGPDEAAAVERRLARDPRARALAEQHRRVWDLLGVADAVPARGLAGSPGFRERTVARAARTRGHWRTAAAGLAAAGLLVAAFAWWPKPPPESWILDDEQRSIVHHLELLEDLDFLESHADELDLALDAELLAAFAGEVAR